VKIKGSYSRKSLKKSSIIFLFIATLALTSCASPSTSESSEPTQSSEEDGVSNKQPSGTVSEANALKAGKNYLNFTAFSKKGLIEQLEFDGYSNQDATYAAGAIEVDWNEQAAKAGKNYLSFTSFSKKGLIEQLEFDGYTKEQAKYGASANGL